MSHGREHRPGPLPDPRTSSAPDRGVVARGAEARLHTRRRVLAAGAIGAFALALPRLASARAEAPARTLAFEHLHTGERLRATYWEDGGYVEGALRDIDHLLRDHRTDESQPIEPTLLDLLHRVRLELGSTGPWRVVSGYRSPRTNEMLRARGSGVARRSLHLYGMAIDASLPDRELDALRRAAVAQRAGGVGFYPDSGFVHLDVGRVRTW